LNVGDNTKDESLFDLSKNFLIEDKKKKGDAYLGGIHRLDRPCSGIIVFAKTSKAAGRLAQSFRDRQVEKGYLAVVNGLVLNGSECRHQLIISSKKRTQVVGSKTNSKTGVEAVLRYRPIKSIELRDGTKQTLLQIELETGRKHQIRSQLSYIGHPIVGDTKYGAPQRFRERLFLFFLSDIRNFYLFFLNGIQRYCTAFSQSKF
jgi:23S rRNA pseudouridine1911/1915/1917 synthase